jgi:exonuclease SbcC
MIRELIIANFQSHEDTKLKFCPGVNVIVGPSDSGKSAIIRALRWVLFNKGGTGAFSHWSPKSMSVSVVLDDLSSVSRNRAPKGNTYCLCHTPKDGFPTMDDLSAVGNAVPPAVEEMLNVSDLNMQRQGDPYFLLNDGPADVARTLNEIAGLTDIDEAHTRIAGKIREYQASERRNAEDLQEVETSLTKYEGLDEIRGRLAVINREESHVQGLHARMNALAGLLTSYERLQQDCARLGSVAILEEDCRKASIALSGIEHVERRCSRLTLFLSDAEQAHRDQTALDGIADYVEQGEQLRLETEKLNSDTSRLLSLVDLCKAIQHAECLLIQDTQYLAKAEKELKDLGSCPTCGADPEHWRKAV